MKLFFGLLGVVLGAFIALVGLAYMGYTHQGAEPENADTIGASILVVGLALITVSAFALVRSRKTRE